MPRHKSVHPFTRDGDNKLANGRVAFAYRQRIWFYQVSPKGRRSSTGGRRATPHWDGGGLDKEIVGCIGTASARPLEVNHRVDQDIGDVDPFWPQIPCDRLGTITVTVS